MVKMVWTLREKILFVVMINKAFELFKDSDFEKMGREDMARTFLVPGVSSLVRSLHEHFGNGDLGDSEELNKYKVDSEVCRMIDEGLLVKKKKDGVTYLFVTDKLLRWAKERKKYYGDLVSKIDSYRPVKTYFKENWVWEK